MLPKLKGENMNHFFHFYPSNLGQPL